MITLCIIVLAFCLVLWYKVSKQYLTPINHVNIFSIMWLFILVGSALFPLDLVLEPFTFLVLLLSWLFYLIGSYSYFNIEIEDFEHEKEYDLRKLKIVLYVLIIMSVATYAMSLGDIINSLTSLSNWASVRSDSLFSDATSDNMLYTIFARNYTIYIPIAFFLYKQQVISKRLVLLITLYGFLTSLLNFSRAPILEFVVVSFVSYMFVNDKKKIPVISISLFVLAFVMFFVFSQSMLFSMNEYSVFDANYQMKMYLFGSVSNYQLILNNMYPDNMNYDSPYFSIDFINYILHRFGLIETYPEQVREFNKFVDDTNVYTFLDAFTLDLGLFGAFAGSFLIGYFNKKIYFSYLKSKSLITLLIYSLICYFTVMSYVNNEYIRFAFLLFIVKVFIIEKISVSRNYSFTEIED